MFIIAPKLTTEQQMDKRGLTINKLNGQVKIMKPTGEIVLEACLHHKLYEIDARPALPDPGPIEVAFTFGTAILVILMNSTYKTLITMKWLQAWT